MAEALVNAFTVARTEGELMSMLNCMDVKRRESGVDVAANRVVGAKFFIRWHKGRILYRNGEMIYSGIMKGLVNG